MFHRPLLSLFGALCAAVPAFGADPAVPAPPPPAAYDVRIRYRIDAFRNEHVAQYAEMMRYLQAHGFRRAADEEVPENEAEDPQATLLHGTVPGRQALELLGERHVKSILLVPEGSKLPQDKDALVRVDLLLAGGFAPDRQRLLHEQAREVLASLNFREGVGYDNRGYTRLVGAIPAGQLDTLLTDLRRVKAGESQPAPFASVWPLRATLALPDMPPPSPRPRPPQVPPELVKLTADLREVVANAGQAAAPRRLEVLLAAAPSDDDRTWRRRLAGPVTGLVIEGRVGALVTVLLPAARAAELAALPDVVAVRLPRVARPGPQAPGGPAETWRPLLEASGAARLHDLKYRGKGTRVAVIDGDFTGWEDLVGKQLPATTRLLDLTRERNRTLLPDPLPAKGPPGPGTRRAVTLMRASPEADLTLIRIDPAAPYMLYQVARAINGDEYHSVSLDNRLSDLDAERTQLDSRRDALLEERRLILEDFGQGAENVKRREAYRKKQSEFDQDYELFQQKIQRYLRHQKDVRALKGIRVVASAPVWDEGFPADGSSTLSRYFDDRPFRGALWFQAAGDARGQSWSGLFRDSDGNGVMEFAPPDSRLPPGRWTPELNFLAWRPAEGRAAADLPAGARLRVSLQWREAHESLYRGVGEDPYRVPLARLRLVVLRQLDPAGKTRPADDLEVVAQSAGLPQRLEQTPHGAVYEQTVEVVVPRAGRYAVRVEGRPPEGTLPPEHPTIPGARKKSAELRVRLFVTTLAGPGRAVWSDFATDAGSVGVPGDARSAITVGAADAAGQRQPYSAGGPPFDLGLLAKPDVMTYDDGQGTGEAAAFAAGLAAAARSAAPSWAASLPALSDRPGGLLRVPPGWPRRGRDR
jgi:hypothetical protein